MIEAVVGVAGARRAGIRISPVSPALGIANSDPKAACSSRSCASSTAWA